RDEEQRMIERADPRDDTQRLAHRVVEYAWADRDRRALHLGDESGEVVHVTRADLDVVEHRVERIAGVHRVDPRELLGVLAHHGNRASDARGALLRRRVAPSLEAFERRPHRPIDDLRIGHADGAERYAGSRTATR